MWLFALLIPILAFGIPGIILLLHRKDVEAINRKYKQRGKHNG